MVRRLILLIVSAGLVAAVLVALATASRTAGAAPSVSPSAETAWPWEPQGSIPAGPADNNWEHGKADLADSQFSYWKQINTSNVANLKVAWTQHLAAPDYAGPIQGSPIVVSGKNKNIPLESGTMYVAADAGVVALDPTNGKILWKYKGPPPKPNAPGGTPAPQLVFGNTTKYFTYCNGAITTGQQDGSIAALNAKTGAPLWTNQVSAVAEFAGHTGQTSPPTDCLPNGGPSGSGVVFGGPNGSSSPLRGHMDAIDLKTGKLVWRWFTTPDPTQLPFILTWGNPAESALGGGGTWSSASIDPGLHMLYSATGNAYAQLGRQPGKDLWTASSFALDTDTGALKWYFQEAHHDNWDLDHGSASILMNTTINGKTYPAFVNCNKVGNCEVLDRRNGRPLPNFPMKEVAVYDPSGKGLALNNEYPTQPWFTCAANQLGPPNISRPASAHIGVPVPKGTPCGFAFAAVHSPNDQDAAYAIATYPIGPDGSPMKAEPAFTASYSDHYTVSPTCGSCSFNYNRSTYYPPTNSFIGCANNLLAAQENVSPTDWHKSSVGVTISQVWISSIDLSKNTMNWQDQLWGGVYKNGTLTPGVNKGFTDGTWSAGCYGGNITTAGNLLFVASRGDTSDGSTASFTLTNHRNWGGTLAAFNATTGEGPLWTWQAPGGEMNGSPITYSVNGKQYVAIYHRLPQVGTAAYDGYGDQLTVFSI
jgi:quinohemoprotein ethanol dehydrogenase